MIGDFDLRPLVANASPPHDCGIVKT